MRRSVRPGSRALCLTLAALLPLAACATYGEGGGGIRTWQSEPAERILAHEPPHERIRVVLAEETLRLEGARLEADSVVGFRELPGGRWERVAVPLAGAERLEVKKLNVELTALVVGASLGLGILGLVTGQ